MSAIFTFKPVANFHSLPFSEIQNPLENKQCPICLESFDETADLVSHNYQGIVRSGQEASLSRKVQHIFHKTCAKLSFNTDLEQEKKPLCTLCKYPTTFRSAREILESEFAKKSLSPFATQEILERFIFHVQSIISNNLPIKFSFDEEEENEIFTRFLDETLKEIHIDFIKNSPKRGNETFSSSYLHFLTFEMLRLCIEQIDDTLELLNKFKDEILESDPSLSEEECIIGNTMIEVQIRKGIDHFFDKLKIIVEKRKKISSLDVKNAVLKVNPESVTHMITASILYGFMLFYLHSVEAQKDSEEFNRKALLTYVLGLGAVFVSYVFRDAWIRKETEEETLARRISKISIN